MIIFQSFADILGANVKFQSILNVGLGAKTRKHVCTHFSPFLWNFWNKTETWFWGSKWWRCMTEPRGGGRIPDFLYDVICTPPLGWRWKYPAYLPHFCFLLNASAMFWTEGSAPPKLNQFLNSNCSWIKESFSALKFQFWPISIGHDEWKFSF